MKTLHCRLLYCAILFGCIGVTADAADAPAGPGAAGPAATGATGGKLFNWSVNSIPLAPKGVPILQPVDKESKPAADEIRVGMRFGGSYYGEGYYNIKKGTTAIDALKQAGAEQFLTQSARIVISTRVKYEVGPKNSGQGPTPAAVPSASSDARAAMEAREATEEIIVDVAAVRAGKAKDVVFGEMKAKNYEILMLVSYAEFHFPGGTPADFVRAMQDHFGVDWSVVQIPPEMSKVHIPEFRHSVLEIVGSENDNDNGERVTAITEMARLSRAGDVVGLYNAIASKNPAIGIWHVIGPSEGDFGYYRPSIVMLLPPASDKGDAKAPSLKVKALPLEGIPENRWTSVKQAIASAQAAANAELADANPPGERLDGKVSIQAESKTLVVVGTQGYIDLAESVVAADYKNEAVEHPAPRPTPGATSAKP